MEFSADKIQLQCTHVSLPASGGRTETLSLELELPQEPALLYQVVCVFGAAALAACVEVVGANAARPAALVSSDEVSLGLEARFRGLGPDRGGSGERSPLVVVMAAKSTAAAVSPARQPSRDEADESKLDVSEVLTEVSTHIYGVCQGPLQLLLRCTADGDPDKFLQDMCPALALPPPLPTSASTVGTSERSSIFTFLLRQGLRYIQLDALPLPRADITAAHLVPLLNAAQCLRGAGPSHQAEAAEADLLAGLALMRSRKFTQCSELWQRCARYLLDMARLRVKQKGVQSMTQTSLQAGAPLSISPFAHRISASGDASVNKAIFLQVLIADCMIEHSAGPLKDQNLRGVLSALHQATQLHLAEPHLALQTWLEPLASQHDANTALLAMQPHLVHVLCAVVAEALRAEVATQWCQVAASALRCLEFAVQSCIGCALDPLVIDTMVQCFNSCEPASSEAKGISQGPASSLQVYSPEDGREGLRAALHHLVETMHDVLPSISGRLLRPAAKRLAERLLGAQGQRGWPPLCGNLLRLLMRVVVVAGGDVAAALVSGLGVGDSPSGVAGGSLPFFDYLLQLLSSPADELKGSATLADANFSCHATGGPGGLEQTSQQAGVVVHVGWRCWGVLRIHLLPYMARSDLRLFVRWLTCCLSDSRASYPAARALLLQLVIELAEQVKHNDSEDGHDSSPPPGQQQRPSLPLRAAPSALTTMQGMELLPVLRPLRDWLQLLAARHGALRGGTEFSEEAVDDSEMPSPEPGQFLSENSHGLLPMGAISLQGGGRDLGGVVLDEAQHLGIADEKGDGIEESSESCSAARFKLEVMSSSADFPCRRSTRRHLGRRRKMGENLEADHCELGPSGVVFDGSGGSVSSTCGAMSAALASTGMRGGGQSLGSESNSGSEQFMASAGQDTRDPPPGSDAGHLLLVWRALVASAAAVPKEMEDSKPCLFSLARPILEEVQKICLEEGSPCRQALGVTLAVLRDLGSCEPDSEALVFLQGFLSAYCEWIPHSVVDETFSVLDELLRILGRAGLRDSVVQSLTQAMLDPYTLRSRAHHNSQKAFVDLLVGSRSSRAQKHRPRQGCSPVEEAHQVPHTRVPLPTPPCTTGESEKSASEESDGGDDSIDHFKDVLCLCLGLQGQPEAGDQSAELEEPAKDLGEPDLVSRLQFLNLVFKDIRYSHVAYLIREKLAALRLSLRTYCMHPLERVRLLALDLLGHLCYKAFQGAASPRREESEMGQLAKLFEVAVDVVLSPLGEEETSTSGLCKSVPFNEELRQLPATCTPATALACCRLLHDALLYLAEPGPGGTSESGQPGLTLVLQLGARVLHALRNLAGLVPCQLPRLASLSAALAWSAQLARLRLNSSSNEAAPKEQEDQVRALRIYSSALKALAKDGILQPADSAGRLAALRLLHFLPSVCPAKVDGQLDMWSGLDDEIREAISALRGDWCAEVRTAALELCRAMVEPSTQVAKHALPAAPHPQQLRGAASAWGPLLWASPLVTQLPAVRGLLAAGFCMVDRFEDFLDSSEHMQFVSGGSPLERDCLGSLQGSGSSHAQHRVIPDPELERFFGQHGDAETSMYGASAVNRAGDDAGEMELHAVRSSRHGDQSTGRSRVEFHQPEDGDGGEGGQAYRMQDGPRSGNAGPGYGDDLMDEDDLGIIDDGDEEWLEVFDLIREHSAVTIFNHTDSTWYVSGKHPHFVRPLHGKRRTAAGSGQGGRQRSPSPANLGLVTERSLGSPPLVARMTAVSGEAGGRSPRDRVAAAAVAAAVRRQRPHSAPNRVRDDRANSAVAAAAAAVSTWGPGSGGSVGCGTPRFATGSSLPSGSRRMSGEAGRGSSLSQASHTVHGSGHYSYQAQISSQQLPIMGRGMDGATSVPSRGNPTSGWRRVGGPSSGYPAVGRGNYSAVSNAAGHASQATGPSNLGIQERRPRAPSPLVQEEEEEETFVQDDNSSSPSSISRQPSRESRRAVTLDLQAASIDERAEADPSEDILTPPGQLREEPTEDPAALLNESTAAPAAAAAVAVAAAAASVTDIVDNRREDASCSDGDVVGAPESSRLAQP